MDLQQKQLLTKAEILTTYLDESNIDQPWTIGWSGGKDSTTVLKLVCEVLKAIPLEKRKRKVYAIMSDTKMENPILENYMHEQVFLVNKWAQENQIPLEAEMVYRELSRSFFYLILGKGYPLPNSGKNRWCTHSLKIEPQNKKVSGKEPVFQLLGVRSDESARRAASIERYREEKESRFANDYAGISRVYMPIVHFTTEEVWDILHHPLPWGSSEDIRRLYREATGECATVNPNGATELANACGARFGCWTCPPISKDKSTENMSTIHEWMKPLTVWRKNLMDTYKNKDNKSGFRRNGKSLGYGKGCLKIEARQHLLDTLLKTQNTVNELRADVGLDPTELIGEEEVQLIYDQWKFDAELPWFSNEVATTVEGETD